MLISYQEMFSFRISFSICVIINVNRRSKVNIHMCVHVSFNVGMNSSIRASIGNNISMSSSISVSNTLVLVVVVLVFGLLLWLSNKQGCYLGHEQNCYLRPALAGRLVGPELLKKTETENRRKQIPQYLRTSRTSAASLKTSWNLGWGLARPSQIQIGQRISRLAKNTSSEPLPCFPMTGLIMRQA